MTAPAAGRWCVLGAGRGSAELVDLLGDVVVGAAAGPSADVVALDDQHPKGPKDVAGAPVVGTLAAAVVEAQRGRALLSGIANSRTKGVRLVIVDKLAGLGLPPSAWGTFVHPAARISPRATVGRGAIVYPGVQVAVDARVEEHALLYFNAVVHHDAVVGRGSILCAGVLLAGHVQVGEGAYLGIGAVVKDGVTVGANALVGMGAVVTKDVPEGAVVKGVPART
ncbi:MAG: acetyltransferase [Deltaproteobacteria bacterium]|nr:acetyltransferase [Deltaproteobacteria bacterium]